MGGISEASRLAQEQQRVDANRKRDNESSLDSNEKPQVNGLPREDQSKSGDQSEDGS